MKPEAICIEENNGDDSYNGWKAPAEDTVLQKGFQLVHLRSHQSIITAKGFSKMVYINSSIQKNVTPNKPIRYFHPCKWEVQFFPNT